MINTLIHTTRPWSFVMTVISVLIGTLILPVAAVKWFYFILVLVGMILLHGATNVLNDYFDFKNGIDFKGAPTTIYRRHPLVEGLMSPKGVLLEAMVLFIAAGLIGIFLTMKFGWPIALFAAIGGLASISYTGWIINFKYKAMGEVVVFFMWGPLMIFACFFIQSQSWENILPVLLISIPHGLWVSLVILANNLKDIDFDKTTHIKTAGTLLKKEGTLRLFTLLCIAVYLCTILLIAFKVLPVWSLITLLSVPKTIGLIKHFKESDEIPVDADPMTAQTGTIYGVLFVVSLILGNLFAI
jgi:1,4-dihydroxy-2-naphthoate octaprenyltransferase